MHVTTDTLNLFNLILGILLTLGMIGVAAFIGWKWVRGATFKAQGEILAQNETAIKSLRGRIKMLESMARVQEKRLSRAEMENQRKERLLFAARQEIEYFEDVVGILLPVIAKFAPEDKKRADALLKKLGEFRRKSAREQTEWEETKDALALYLDGPECEPDEDE